VKTRLSFRTHLIIAFLFPSVPCAALNRLFSFTGLIFQLTNTNHSPVRAERPSSFLWRKFMTCRHGPFAKFQTCRARPLPPGSARQARRQRWQRPLGQAL